MSAADIWEAAATLACNDKYSHKCESFGFLCMREHPADDRGCLAGYTISEDAFNHNSMMSTVSSPA